MNTAAGSLVNPAPTPEATNEQRADLVTPRPAASFRPDVEGLRAVAILLVVAFHVGIAAVRGGFVGVDVFFVLSGYLITGLLLNELAQTGRIHILGFYARRARRLLPGAALMITTTVVAVTLLLSPDERQLYSRSAFAAAVYASNLWFQFYSAGYFDADVASNPLLHTWSLAVEEQFYLVWPLVMVAIWHWLRSKQALAISLAVLTIASFAACLWLSAKAPVAAFYASPARAWEFGVGGMAALIPVAMLVRLRSYSGFVGLTGIVGIIVGAFTSSADMSFPNAQTLFPVIGTAAVLVAGTAPARFGVNRLLSLGPLLVVGRLSYSWYLWHWPVLAFAAVMLPGLGVPGRAVAAALSLAIAALSYALVEAPIRFNRHLAKSAYATLALAALITLSTAEAGRLARRFALEAADTPKQHLIDAARTPVVPALAASGCFVKKEGLTSPDCTFGDAESAITVVLFGDSHAAQWFTAFESIANDRRWRLVVLTKMGCPAARTNILMWTAKNAPYVECATWREAALQRILALRPALVVLSGSDNHVTFPSSTAPRRLSLDQWRDGMRATLGRLNAAGIRSVILRDTPGPGLDVPTCLSRADVRHQSTDVCTVPRSRAIREDVFRASVEAAAGLRNVTTLDLTDYFCTADVCPPVIGGSIVYGQPGHIAHGFGRTLAGVISRQLQPLATQ